MQRSRKSMDFKAQVLALREAGHGFKTIARSLSASKNTIKRICEEAAAPAAPLPTSPSTPSPPWADKIDWKEVVREVRAGVTLKQLFKEHAPEVGYTGFRRQVRKLAADTPRASIPLTHVPGEKVQVDYTKGVELEPGSERSVRRGTELFVGVLPHSGKIFARFFLDQKLPSFIAAHEAMFAFFGGVTPYVVIDNLKAGVSKAHRYDPDENKTYCDFGNHMGFAVLPCRPATPRDKGAVENAIGIIQRTFYHEVRNRRFDSLHALNSALGEFLVRLNAEVMKDYGVSRDERFLREAPSLRPLPADPFELAEWREAKVHPDCEIQVDKNFYSVPYTLVGRSVRVKLGRNIVEVFDLELGRVTRHARLRGIGQHSRYDWHYPSERLQQARYEIRNAKDDADRVGPQTRAVIEVLFAGQWPLRGLRRAQGVLRCARAYGNDALEHACGKALHFKKYRVDFIKDCAMTFHRGQEEFRHGATPMRDEATLFLHSEYARTLQ